MVRFTSDTLLYAAAEGDGLGRAMSAKAYPTVVSTKRLAAQRMNIRFMGFPPICVTVEVVTRLLLLLVKQSEILLPAGSIPAVNSLRSLVEIVQEDSDFDAAV